MARSRLTDYMQVNRFHLLDTSWSGGPILLPVFGFRSVTLPQWNLTYKEIKEGNYEFKRYGAVQNAEVTPMVLEQGVSLLNSDFYQWIKDATLGQKEPRNLLLIQFTGINVSAGGVIEGVGSALANATSNVPGATGGGFLFEDGIRIPGRAWYLKNCRPFSYKPGSDFDATSGEVSLATLEIGLEEFEEFSLGL